MRGHNLNDLTGGGPGIVVVRVVRAVVVFVAFKVVIAVKETAAVVAELEVPLLNLATVTLCYKKKYISPFQI
jgi:hypothetical protein